VDTLTFADGSSMISKIPSYHKVYEILSHVKESVIQFSNGLTHICLPELGVYLVTFYISNINLVDTNFAKQELQITFSTCMTFPIFNQTCTGTFTIEMTSETFTNIQFKLIHSVIAESTNNHVSITRIA